MTLRYRSCRRHRLAGLFPRNFTPGNAFRSSRDLRARNRRVDRVLAPLRSRRRSTGGASTCAANTFHPRGVILRHVQRLELLPRGTCGRVRRVRLVLEVLSDELDVAAMRNLRERLAGCAEPYVFSDESAVRDRDATRELVLAPPVQAI